MAGFWDDPDVRTQSEWVRFDSVGDHAKGTISKLGKKVWTDGSIGIEVNFAEEGSAAMTASQTLLKQGLFELKPVPGDYLRVTLAAIEKRPGGKTLKRFKIELKRPDGDIETIDQTEDGADSKTPVQALPVAPF